MPLKTEGFRPLRSDAESAEKLEVEVNSWAEKNAVNMKNVVPVTVNLPDRTMVLLVFYSPK